MTFEAEVDDILRELLREEGTLRASIRKKLAGGSGLLEPDEVIYPIGDDFELRVALSSSAPATASAAAERAATQLRTCVRRYGVSELPETSLIGRAPRTRAMLLRRAGELLGALCAMHGGIAAALLRGPELVAKSGDLDDERRERLAFLRKRIDAEALRRRGKSSHAEIVGPDLYARSFWFDAYLILFFESDNWSVDFVRHRVLAVTREISMLLPHLDDDPTTPAQVRPLPGEPKGPE